MRVVFDHQLRGHRGPAIGIEYRPAKKLHEPGPVCILIVVGGHVKAKPAAAIFHVARKRVALLLVVGKIVQHHHHGIVLQLLVVEVAHVAGGVEHKAVARREVFEEPDGITRKVHVVALHFVGVEGEHFKTRKLRHRQVIARHEQQQAEHAFEILKIHKSQITMRHVSGQGRPAFFAVRCPRYYKETLRLSASAVYLY